MPSGDFSLLSGVPLFRRRGSSMAFLWKHNGIAAEESAVRNKERLWVSFFPLFVAVTLVSKLDLHDWISPLEVVSSQILLSFYSFMQNHASLNNCLVEIVISLFLPYLKVYGLCTHSRIRRHHFPLFLKDE